MEYLDIIIDYLGDGNAVFVCLAVWGLLCIAGITGRSHKHA